MVAKMEPIRLPSGSNLGVIWGISAAVFVRFYDRLLYLLLAFTWPFMAAAVHAAEPDVQVPDCPALEGWASAIDGDDHWMPVEGNRAWVPRAFQEPSFAALFGVPALEWSTDDAKTVATHLYKCGQQAAKDRRIDARNALYKARGYMISKLRGVLHARDKAAALAARKAEREAERMAREKGRHGKEMPHRDQAESGTRTETQPQEPTTPQPDNAQSVASRAGSRDTGMSPRCADIRAWIQSAEVESTFEPLPDITLSRLFEDDSFAPFFGRPVVSLKRDDFGPLHNQIFDCRKRAAAQHDTVAQTVFHKALNATKDASRAMRLAWTAQSMAKGQVKNLLGGMPRVVADDPNFFTILEIAEESLQGSDVSADVAELDRRLQGYGRRAAELADHRPYLSKAEIGEYITRLREKRQSLQAEATASDEQLAQLLEQIAATSVSQAGLVQLRRLHYQTDTSAMTRENVESYNQAFQSRWRYITNEIQRQQARAKQALASNPVLVAKVLDRVVDSEIGPSMTVAGVRTGITSAKAASVLSNRMGYGEATSFGYGKQYTVTGKDLKRYTEEEGRDGGLVNLQTRRGIVGEIEYIEHFTGPIDIVAAKQAIGKHFGDPDEESRQGPFTAMTWAQGDHILKVILGPRINGVARFSGDWRSSLQLVLQSEDFAAYLKEAEERCARLRDKPASALSINDRQDILRGCLTP